MFRAHTLFSLLILHYEQQIVVEIIEMKNKPNFQKKKNTAVTFGAFVPLSYPVKIQC